MLSQWHPVCFQMYASGAVVRLKDYLRLQFWIYSGFAGKLILVRGPDCFQSVFAKSQFGASSEDLAPDWETDEITSNTPLVRPVSQFIHYTNTRSLVPIVLSYSLLHIVRSYKLPEQLEAWKQWVTEHPEQDTGLWMLKNNKQRGETCTNIPLHFARFAGHCDFRLIFRRFDREKQHALVGFQQSHLISRSLHLLSALRLLHWLVDALGT